jgi:lipopolysaccharide export system permease protein
MRAKLMIRYLLGEMIPTFFLGVIVFVFILLMFQALRLTEFVLVHGVKLSTVALMMAYMSTSFLPILFPMSLLFAVLLTYSRLSADSEVVAFRSVGLSMSAIVAPAIILSLLIGALSLQTSYHIAPWGNRQFEVLVTKLGATKPGVTIKEGTFSEGFFDLVVYANKVDSKKGKLSQVFIFDERNPGTPLTVIAREGVLMYKQDAEQAGNSAALRLIDGDIHRTSEGRHTKIDFSTYDIFLSDPATQESHNKSPQSLTIEELGTVLKDTKLETDQRLEFETEYHKRTAIAFACILFALIGVGLGTTANRRNVKSGGMVICLSLIVAYYVIFVVAEGAARKGQLPPLAAMWLANLLFSIAAVWSLRRAWR